MHRAYAAVSMTVLQLRNTVRKVGSVCVRVLAMLVVTLWLDLLVRPGD